VSRPDPRFPVRFDRSPWEQDMAGSTPAGRTAAQTARASYESAGVLCSHLRPCETEGRDGTNLRDCAKVYLPQPSGRFGMIFTVDRDANGPALVFVAFGVRHHPTGLRAQTVYDVAHRRLNG
jgi:hypothetical protein